MKAKTSTNTITKAAVIATLYTILILLQTILPFQQLTFGPIQLRLAEGLTVLSLMEAAAVPGLFVGCLISNIFLSFMSGYGMIDIICGSLVTLLAAYLTRKAKSKYLAMLPPIILNGFLVSIWVSYFSGIPYFTIVLGIMGGEAISVVVFGSLIYYIYDKRLKKVI